MKGPKKYLCLILLTISFVAEAQYFSDNNSWKTRRKEYTFGGGVTNYMGDLGGLDKKGTNWFLFDLEFSKFKYGFLGSYRYNISHKHASSSTLFYGKIEGSDQLTSDPWRNYRNLSFTTHIVELTWTYEYYLIRPQPGHIYDIQGAKGQRPQKFDVYGYLGVGLFYYAPFSQGYPLRYYGTEGQGLPGGGVYYSPVAVSFPLGASGHYHINKSWKVGVDFCYRWTTTDYLDDVSGNYYDKAKIAELRGDVAAYLSDPSDGSNPTWTQTGEVRGDPKWRDGFMTAMVKVAYMPLKTSGLKNQRKKYKGSSNKGFAKGRSARSGKQRWWMY